MNRLALLALVFVSSLAIAQAPTRVRGTITALEGDVLSVKARDGSDVKVHLTSDVGVATAKNTTLAELKGKAVGVTAHNKDGKMVAVEVHALPPTVPLSHGPWDLQPGSTMTNATLEGVAGDNAITVDHKDGKKTIAVPPGTPIVMFVPGTRADLKPGEFIFTTARNEGGKLVTGRIAVSKDGVRPPQ
jgi:hypothetical protein